MITSWYCVPVLKVSGLSESLSDQNLTLLVPSSTAVGKMSLEDTNFWTTKGNLPSLIRFHINWSFSLGLIASLTVRSHVHRNHMIPGVHPTFSLSNLTSLTSMLKTTHSVSATAEVSPQVHCFRVFSESCFDKLWCSFTLNCLFLSAQLLEEQPSPHQTLLQLTD